MKNVYAEFNYSLLNFISSAVSNHDYITLQKMGLDRARAQRLCDMPLSQLQQFKRMTLPLADISIDPKHFDLCLDYICTEAEHNEIKNKMIEMDASAAMLNELAGMDISEYRSRRVHLGLDRAQQGRPASLSADECVMVSRVWKKYENEKDLLLRYFHVGVETRLPLNRIWVFMRLN